MPRPRKRWWISSGTPCSPAPSAHSCQAGLHVASASWFPLAHPERHPVHHGPERRGRRTGASRPLDRQNQRHRGVAIRGTARAVDRWRLSGDHGRCWGTGGRAAGRFADGGWRQRSFPAPNSPRHDRVRRTSRRRPGGGPAERASPRGPASLGAEHSAAAGPVGRRGGSVRAARLGGAAPNLPAPRSVWPASSSSDRAGARPFAARSSPFRSAQTAMSRRGRW